jgi:catechol 2,3-dioxygenase-like lactoylglutathione lyase family enzyme
MKIHGLHHVARITTDPEAAARFYIDVLGFRAVERPPFDFRGAWLLGYGLQIHIIENQELAAGEKGKIDSRANHLAFSVDDHAPVRARLEELGVKYIEKVNAGGIPQIFFQDPDGHVIEIGIYPSHPPFIDNS